MNPELLVPGAFTILGALVWTLRLAPLYRSRAIEPAIAADAGDVSLIVPARNEAHNLPALLASLDALEPAPGEIIVVDDHSTDGTGDVARAAGARVFTPPELPPGWLGKPWACHHGVQAARGCEDCEEGVRAFREKRAPRWRGR